MKKRIFILFLAALGILFQKSETYAKTQVVMIPSYDDAATRMDTALKKCKKLTVKVKGNKSASKKLLSGLNHKIQTVNKCGVVFKYKYNKKSGKYSLYTVSKDNAQTYTYACKFIHELYTRFKTGHCHGIHGWTYNRWMWNAPNVFSGYSSEYRPFFQVYKRYMNDSQNMSMGEYFKANTVNKPEESAFANEKEYDMLNELYWNNQSSKGFYEKVAINYAELFDSQDFSKLSDAMKVWFVYATGYFEGTHQIDIDMCQEPDYYEYGMVYDFSSGGSMWMEEDHIIMKKLLDNKARGVCSDFAACEKVLFDSLGIKCWKNSCDELNHAWTVLKVKNQSGKVLWIPFDYGIGPSDLVGNSLLDTKEKYDYRFRIMMEGITGAPKTRNYEIDDFVK